MEIRDEFQRVHVGMSDILVTKIMLGVFGNMPAFDKNFKTGLRVSKFGPKAFRKIGDFYEQNRELSDRLEVYNNDVSPLLFGVRQATDRMRLKYLKASPPKDAT